MIDFLLDCSLWHTSCSKLKGIATQKPDRATLNNSARIIISYPLRAS